MKLKTTSLAALLWTAAMSAGAQAQATANSCEKPEAGLPIQGSPEQVSRAQKRVDAYKTCVNDYVKDANGKAQALTAQAQSYTDAANKAIDDYNAFVIERNKRLTDR